MTREGPGAVIGRYKLLQELGEGGFGVVYRAEQTEPVRRTVALKIIKLGMDTRQVIARFEAERQALALMDHPNIAKVLDAGATEGGRPYFVMELVKGVPITEYCDQARLDTAARLELFQRVCNAVQHAHQKGVIHRDLKPSNVLVALHDGVPVPKVIDFGIAKATGRHLTDKTLFTEFRQLIGTPEYMAPEQAEMSGLDIDTRADIYSLGVLLYELLTGTKPHDLKTLAKRGYDEILRTIREVDPQRPSTRVSTMGEQLEAVASKRDTAGNGLGRALKGDLDWIVMKAIEKDRARRYDTANAMALDIQRHLEDQPVSAGPPSPVYHARKYVRRHRVGVAVASVALATLVSGVVLSFAGYADAAERRERARLSHDAAAGDRAAANSARAGETEQRALAETREKDAESDAKRAKTVLELVEEMLGSADPNEVKGRNYTVRQLLDDFDRDLGTRLEGDPEVEAAVRTTMGIAYRNLGLYDKAESHLGRALEIHRRPGTKGVRLATSLNEWGFLQYVRGHYAEAEGHIREALAASAGDSPEVAAHSLSNLGLVLRALGRYAEAEESLRETLAVQRRLGEDYSCVLCNLAGVLSAKGSYEDAEALHREALAIQRKTFGEEHPAVATSLNNLALVLQKRGDYDGAEKLHREALAIERKTLGEEHPAVGASLHNLASVLAARGDYDGAESLYHEALAIRRKTLGEDHPGVAESLDSLGVVLRSKGDYDGADRLQREALAIYRKTVGGEHPDVAACIHNLATGLHARGQDAKAEELFLEALAIKRKSLGDEHPSVALTLNNLAIVLQAKGDLAGAEKLYRGAVAIQRKAFGDEHPHVLSGLENLAVLLDTRGDREEAERIAREALATTRKSLGAVPSSVVVAIGTLAVILTAHGNLEEAEKLYREALAIQRELFGEGCPAVARNLCWLAEVLHARGRYDEAERLHREALVIQRRSPGDGMDLARNLGGLATVLLARGNHDEAEKCRREALAIVRKSLRPGHPAEAGYLGGLAEVLSAKGNVEEAEKLYREALAILRESPGADPLAMARILNNLAVVLGAKGSYDELERLHREALAILREAPGASRTQVARGLVNLAGVLQLEGKHDEAEKSFREGIAILRETVGDEHRAVTQCLERLLQVLAAKGDWPGAEPVCAELLARGRSHNVLAVFGMCLLKQAKYEDAEPILRECLAMREKELPDGWLRWSTESMLGEALCGQGKYAEAEPRLLESYEKMVVPEKARIRKREALERIVKLYEAWGKPEKAAEWNAREAAPGR